ncbi:MAG: hypothetical protein HUU45_14505 [Leptospiraceae bacterium]|nr:hypothetical protein [Leptospiraceae bacterium]
MKKTVIIIVLLICFCKDNEKSNFSSLEIDNNLLTSIESVIKNIDSEKTKMKKIKKNVVLESGEGSELTFYINRETLSKIEIQHFGDSGKSTEEMFLSNNNLLMVKKTVSYYNGIINSKEQISVREKKIEKFFFQNRQLIAWVNADNKTINASKKEYEEEQKYFLNSLDIYSKEINQNE